MPRERVEPRRPLPSPTGWALFGVALAALAFVWMPLSVLQLVDGLLFQRRPLEVARDIALAWPLVLAPAAGLTVLAWLSGKAAGWARARTETVALVAWTVLLAPLTWVCVWQGARTVWLWVKVSLGNTGSLPPGLRLAAVVLLVVGLAVVFYRRAHRILDGVVHQLVALRAAALAVVAACLLAAVPDPPELLGSRVAPTGQRAAGDRPPDIILVSIDSVAAIDARVCDEQGGYMPNLAKFARSATCFSRHYAGSNFTTPTTSTLETSTLPWSHLAVQPDAKILPGLARHALADALRERGYRTVSITDNLLASPRSRGTHRGYDEADLVRTRLFGNTVREAMSIFPDTALPQIAATAWSFTGALDVWWHGDRNPFVSERAYARARDVLAAQPQEQPLFLWVHTLPPHAPYLPPPQTKGRLLPPGELDRWKDQWADNMFYPESQQPRADKHRLRYRESMLAADEALGGFLAELERSGRLERTIVVVTADHGESFEHGYVGHAGPLLHEALVRIPLVIRMPGQTQGRRVDQPMSQADIAPTLLDLVGARALAESEGRTWRPVLEGRPWSDEPIFMMSLENQNRFRPLATGRFAVVDGRFKLWTSLGREPARLYDVLADPGERHDLAAGEHERVVRLESLVKTRLAQAEAARERRLDATR